MSDFSRTKRKTAPLIIALILLLASVRPTAAQGSGENPVYIVQPGENLTQIAQKFGISVQELISANSIVNSDLISEGTQLIIPGIEGISGVLVTKPVAFGESLPAILRKNKISVENFKKLNPVTSPAEIYVGSTLILPENSSNEETTNRIVLRENDSLVSAAVSSGQNPWYLAKMNGIKYLVALPGSQLFYHSEMEARSVSPFSDRITSIEILPLPLVQGHTTIVRVFAKEAVKLSGSVNDKSIRFFYDQESDFYYATHGVHAMADNGLVPLAVNGTFEDGSSFTAQQMVLLSSGQYRNEEITVEETTIELDIIQAENAQVQQIVTQVSDQKLWQGPFRFPVDGSLSDDTIGFTSLFGSRRSYNNGQYSGYHGGLDFEIRLNILNIYAPAPGLVVYTGSMNIRGNTTFIDHGQGVFSGYAHQEEISVAVGDYIQAGQIIGQIGGTGRVTGKHLHWDIWVNGTPVDPFDWIENTYP